MTARQHGRLTRENECAAILAILGRLSLTGALVTIE